MVDSRDAALSSLRDLRDRIDNIDAATIHMFGAVPVHQEGGARLRPRSGCHPPSQKREAEQVTRLRHLASAAKPAPDFAEKFLAFVLREVIRHHESGPR